MGVSLEHWQRIAPPELHALHPDHRDYTGPREAARRPTKRRIPRTDALGRNKLEADFGRELDALHPAPVRWHDYEPFALTLAGRCTYTPDYVLKTTADETHVVECKGLRLRLAREDGIVKLKVAAARWPHWTFWLVQRERGRWTFKRVDHRGIGTPERPSWWPLGI